MLPLRNSTDMRPSLLCATLLATGPYAREAAPYKLLELAGPDAGEFLHRLCTQDVKRLAEGVVVPAAFLDAKGKLQVTALVFRHGESFWLEVHEEQAARLLELLERYHFSEKLSIHGRDLGPVHELVAIDVELEDTEPQLAGHCHWRDDSQAVVVSIRRQGVVFTRCHGAELRTSGAGLGLEGDAVTAEALSFELAEAVRMLAGFVRVGVETEASTLALEANLDDHCSTKKGCYTGQEIVARIHTYGHVNRKLCLLRLAAGEPIAEPMALHECEDDIPVGRVMHAVALPAHDMRLGLGYLPKDFQAIGTKLTLMGEGEVEVVTSVVSAATE